MAYPLVVNPISAGIETVDTWGAGSFGSILMYVDLSVTRTTHWDMLFPQNRSVAIEPMPRPHQYSNAVDIDVIYTHNFVGIGGVRYIPSFPQWDRQETSFPFAF